MEPLAGEKLIYYSIGFVNASNLIDEFEQYEPDLNQFNSNYINYLDLKTLQDKTIENVTKFIGMDLSDQRKCLGGKGKEKKKEKR